jgi:hypothetical protein
MPTKGVCKSCGEEATLTMIVGKYAGENHLTCLMVCGSCKRYYESKAKEGG